MDDVLYNDRALLVERTRHLVRALNPDVTDVTPRVCKLPGIRAVVFDIYGTLLQSGSGDLGVHEAGDNAKALTEGMALAGLQGKLVDAGIRGAVLLPETIRAHHARARESGVDCPEVEIREIWQDVLSTLAGEGLLDDAGDTAMIELLAIGYECRINPVWPMWNLMETLEGLRSRVLDLGIVSNAQFYTPLLFEAFMGMPLTGLGFSADLCVFSYRQRCAKPSVRLYESLRALLAENRGVAADETLYVGNDMLKDIWAAREAGFRTALFAGDRRSLRLREDDERCRDLKPDVVVTDLKQLLDVPA